MYRIELAPGEEAVFRTIEELAVAVRNGLVTPRCRIYHNATQKWLPIEFHPHYKQALSLPAARIAEAVAPRTSGHPPRLETLSFAVTPAAKSTPAPEPVAEPTAETRAGDHALQPRPLAEQSVQDPWPAKRPVGAQRVAQQGAERHGAERSDAGHSRMESSAGMRHSDAEPSDAEHSGTEHSGAESLDARDAGVEHPVAEQVVPEHPAPEQPATDHPARERAGTTHSTMLHAAADGAAAQAALEHPVVEHPSVAAVPAEHRFAPHANMAPLPSHAEAAFTPKPKSSDRPHSYLPPSVRVVPDDPYVATAPEPATAPFVHTEPVKAWPVLPAVQPAPELPAISYPEFTPAEEPVAERASSSRGYRPLHVAVALLVLAAGGYLARSFYSPVRGSRVDNSSTRAAAVAERPELAEDAPAPAASAVTTKLPPNRPAVVTPTAPASSGFAAALEPRAIATGPAPIPAHATTLGQPPSAATTDSTAAGPIAPAPVEMPMDVPALPDGDSLVAQPRSKSDSGMKRILRAVNGGQDPK